MLHENAIAAIATIVFFIVKIAGIAKLGGSIRTRTSSSASAFIAAWLLVQAGLIAVALIASPFGAVAWYTLSVPLLMLLILHRKQKIHISLDIPTAAFAIIAVAVAVRSLLMFDYTLDAFAYGYPRMAQWMNSGSLLVYMPTVQINIFTNEWNGELNNLFYALFAQNISGATFGNVEILIVLFIATWQSSHALGATRLTSSTIALLIASSPAAIGLTSTTKGDLLAAAAVVMATCFALDAERSKRHWPIAFALIACALAIGSKISALPFCLPIVCYVLWAAWKIPRGNREFGSVAICITASVIFCARYFANFAIYGSPLVRAGGEAPEIGFATFLNNVSLITQRMLFGADAPPFQFWVLSAAFGSATILTIMALPFWFRRDAVGLRPKIVGAIALTSVILMCWAIPSRPWSFRYFLPAILPLTIAIMACTPKRWAFAASAFAIIGALYNVSVVVRPGEFLPPPAAIKANDILGGFSQQRSIERALGFHPGTFEAYGVARLCLDDGPKRIALLTAINTFIFPFIGSGAQNNITLHEDMAQLLRTIDSTAPDLVAISHRQSPSSTFDEVTKRGYEDAADFYSGDASVRIFVRHDMKDQMCSH